MLRGYQYCQLAVAWLTIQFGNFHGCASASPLLPNLEGFESQNVDDWCIFGWTLQSAASSNFACVHHDLDVFECFSGVGSVYCAGNAILGNARGVGFDWKTDPAENILSPQGFEIALKRVLRLSHHGLLTIAPECSSLVFPSSSVHRRSSRQPFGDTSRQCVLASNSIAFTAMFLWVLGRHHARSALFVGKSTKQLAVEIAICECWFVGSRSHVGTAPGEAHCHPLCIPDGYPFGYEVPTDIQICDCWTVGCIVGQALPLWQ